MVVDAAQSLQLLSPGTKTFAVSDNPPVFVRGAGATLIDRDGRPYIDMASGSSVMHVGYGNDAVLAALREQLASGITHVGPHFHTDAQLEFMAALKTLLPAGLSRLHPATNGAEAIEVAIKMCQYATGRRRFLSFQGSYHGRTMGAIAISGARGKTEALGPFAPAVDILPYPETDITGIPSDADADWQGAEAELQRMMDERGDEIAGVFIEPVQGTGGVVAASRSFMRSLSRHCRERRIPLVFDEVFTGFGRTGRLFAFEHFGIEPDLLVLAKSLGGGMPAGLVAASDDIVAQVPAGSISSTFQLHPMAARAATAALAYTCEADLPARALQLESWFIDALDHQVTGSPVRAMRGIGGMFGLPICDRDGQPAPSLCKAIRRRCLDHGLITYECGRGGDVLGLLPPLVISRQEFDEGLDILGEALSTDGPSGRADE